MNKTFHIYFLLAALSIFGCREKVAQDSGAGDVYYTCSMHPQVMESKPGNCPICHMPLIEVRSEKALHPGEIKLSDEQILLGNIRTGSIHPRSLGEEVVLSGTVSANPGLINLVSARAMGRIEKLYVRAPGDYVRKGQAIYAINSDDVNLAIREYLLSIEKQTSLGGMTIDIAAIVEMARRKLEVLGLTASQIDGINRNGFKGNAVDILSPADAIVVAVNAVEGGYVMEGSPVLTIADYSSLWIVAQVYPEDLDAVMSAPSAVASVEELGQPSFRGKLTFVNPEYTAGAKISEARMEIGNDRYKLKPGMRAIVSVVTNSRTVPAVPTNAIIVEEKGATVWVQTGENTFAGRMVQTGTEANGVTEIVRGLKNEDIVVISGAYLLHSEYQFRKGANPMEGHDMSKM